MVVVTRFLLLCTLLLALPAITTAQCVSQLAIQRVWMQGAGGNEKSTFALGETIQFAAQLNNSYGAYMLAANGAQITITTTPSSFHNDTKPVDIPPNISTWTWNATTPSTHGNHAVTVKAYDHFCGVWVEGSANFTVGAGQSKLLPEITHVETFREGDLVFFRLFYADPNNDAMGFGFRGANGSGWAEETYLFSSPSYGRWSSGMIDYPFNLLCDTGLTYESDVEAWIYDSAGLAGQPKTIHLAYSAPFLYSVGSKSGWQQTGLSLQQGDTFKIAYLYGAWSVDHRYFKHVDPAGYPPDIDQQIYQGCKTVPSLPYGTLLGKIGDGPLFFAGKGGTGAGWFKAKAV